MAETVTLFDTLYNQSADQAKAAKMPAYKNTIARQIRSGIDNAQAQLDAAKAGVTRALSVIAKGEEPLDLNAIVRHENTILNAKVTVETLQKLHVNLFGKEYSGIEV